jgi:hypothetical protein
MAKNTIYYVFTLPPVSGGHFVSLEHIAALNAMGFNAKVYYVGAPDGFANFTLPAVRAGAPLLSDDIVVVGEDHKPLLKELRDLSCIKILHHQAFFYTFAGFDSIAELATYPLTRVIVPSDFSAQRLKAIGVPQPIKRVRPAVPDYFAPGEKRLQIAFGPHKRRIEALFLKVYFQARVPEYAHVPWVPRRLRARDGRKRGVCRVAAAGKPGADEPGSHGVWLSRGGLYRPGRHRVCDP